DRVCHGDNRPIFPTTCCQTLIQCREICPLGSDGGMGELGQDGAEGPIPLARFARALLARTFIVARGHASPRSQTWCGFKPCHINTDLCPDHFCPALVDPGKGVQEFDGACKGEGGSDHGRRAVTYDGQGSPSLIGWGVDTESAQG